ncbi:hypothetical protein K505DRAFT_331213 [Melanomma pulvis-pyrius CBS 109.77]|uniref:Uncharacterized protein n=1 Tax=Melanomma pulvis-pyrius CBS 109.77 TaxID=1314802 RepID=A0A6A6XZD4_9PLEO|nr:hypothetical protein K505DRAFT_331213 [Melanomma pulvis-pyrius CBS 109.77]
MPAPLAKGPGRRSPSSPQSHARAPPPRPNHPLQTGLIIAASVLVAAGIAIYESPQVRQWVDQSRRKIAVALHSLGDEIQPRRPSECSEDFEARQQRREDLIRRNRNELIRRAREEGIAVDLDELARIGKDDMEMAQRRQRSKTNASSKSFDDLVASDGTLKKEEANATGTETADTGLRRRGANGFDAGSMAANPFADEAHVLFDHDTDEAPSPKPFTYIESRESSATVEVDHPASSASSQLIDLTPDSAPFHPENPQTASIPHSEAGDNDPAAQSFYSFTSSSLHNSTHPDFFPVANDDDDEAEHISTGTLTPRSEHSAFTGASVVGSHADDIAVLSMQSDDDHDARSENFSEGGFTDAGFSEAGFSEVGEGRLGAMTPASWTDVGSDDESEWGGPAQGGQVSQVHQ